MRQPPLDDRELFDRHRHLRDRDARQQLIHAYLPLAESLAVRYRNRGIPVEDLRQVAALGLVKAVDRFDAERGSPFHAFATPTILGELRRHFRDHSGLVRLPRRLSELSSRIASEVETLTQRLGRSPSTAEVARVMGCGEEDVIAALDSTALRYPSSLNGNDGSAGGAGARPSDMDAAERGYDRAEARIMAASILAGLGERDRRIVYLRFHRQWSLARIGNDIGVSQMHVSRLLRRTLGRLRETMHLAS